MSKRIGVLLCGLAIASFAMAQTVFMTSDSVAVFYPSSYDAKQHQPSPIFEREPSAVNPLTASWPLRVDFSEKEGHSIATIHVADDVDFYGLHQATKITIDFMSKKLKLAHPERAPFDIMNYGNTSSTTVPLVLTDWPYRASGIDTTTWKKVVLSAYGIGLSWGSIACDLSNTHIYRPINQ